MLLNLGEIVAGSSDKGKLRVTTDLQAFGLIVTAEPYSAVRQPSDVVVLENQIRPDTIGKSEPVQAKYELLPRGHYTYTVPDNLQQAEGNGYPCCRRISIRRYWKSIRRRTRCRLRSRRAPTNMPRIRSARRPTCCGKPRTSRPEKRP